MIVSFTPIRSGSKGIPHKNIRLLNGKPLFHHVVLEAQKVSSLNEVWISTDSDYYASLVPPGVQVHMRSKESALDKSPTADVIMEFVKTRLDIATIVILQATSPTTTYKDIEEALGHSVSGKGCVSVLPANVNLYYENEPLWTTRTRRQDSRVFVEDGGINVIHVADFLKTKSIPTFPCHTMVIQHPVCDIDTEEEFERASALLCPTNTTVIYVGDTYVRFTSKFCTEQSSTPTLCWSKKQLKEFIVHQIKQMEENKICISTGEQSHYNDSDASDNMIC